MAKRRGRGSKTRHGTRKWVLKALAGSSAGGMPTAAIQRRVTELSGTKIPSFSTYQALRTLAKRGQVKVTHRGRENIYWPAGATPATPARRGRPPKSVAAPSPPVAVAQTTQIQVVHTLAPGEVAILHVGETHVEAATNEHGKLVIAHHPRRAASTSA